MKHVVILHSVNSVLPSLCLLEYLRRKAENEWYVTFIGTNLRSHKIIKIRAVADFL